MSKIQVRLSLNRKTVEEGREAGVDLAKAAEWGIKTRTAALKALGGIEDIEAN